MVGRKVILHNFNNATAEVTFFQGHGKPLVAAMLDENGKRMQHIVGCEMRDMKILTSKYTFIND
jgi:hypothetical protein